MNKKKNKDNNIGLIILLIILIGAVGFVLYYNQSNKSVESEEKEEEVVKHDNDEINSYYEIAKLSYEYDTGIPKTDLSAIEFFR